MIKYDYDIRKVFDDTLGEDAIYHLCDSVNDKEILRIATELLRDATERLGNDLDNDAIENEYNKLTTIILMLQEIIENYV